MDKVVEEGKKFVVHKKVIVNPSESVWAQVSIKADGGTHILLSTANNDIDLDAHLEYLEYEFPALKPGKYTCVTVVGTANEEVLREVDNIVIKKKVAPKPKPKLKRSPKTTEKQDKTGLKDKVDEKQDDEIRAD